MSEVTKPDRTVDTVTAEIQYIQQQVKKIFYDAVVQIGTRLLEVKEMVPHGEWTNYLEIFESYLEEKFGESSVAAMWRGQRSGIKLAFTFYPTVNEYLGRKTVQIVIQNYQ